MDDFNAFMRRRVPSQPPESNDDYEHYEKLAQNSKLFKALYVIVFSHSAKFSTVEWLIKFLTEMQGDDGAELLVRIHDIENEGVFLEVGATHYRLLAGAEALEIKKEDTKGNMRDFFVCELNDFLKPSMELDDILSTSEKQRVILEELMNLRAMKKESLYGYPNIQLYPGQSIIQVCINNGIIDSIYPLHNVKELDSLKRKWTYKRLPLNDIRDYFGESIAFYFGFIHYYTWALVPPAFIGLCQTIYSFDITRSHVLFAIFKMIWLTLFLEFWKRKSNEFAYIWGTLKLVNIPKLHPTFRGHVMEQDPVTKLCIPSYPASRRHFKVYCVSLPLVCLCLVFAVIVMLIYFQIEDIIVQMFSDESLLSWTITLVPGLVYSVAVIVMNILYRYVAYVLTEWENHKTQDSFDNHRIVKLLLFEFVNNFIAMGYTAFFLQDLNSLKSQIAIMMLMNQLFGHLQGTLLPFFLQKRNTKWKRHSSHFKSEVQEIIKQHDMWSYEGTYDDYLELFIQFGYVFLFSSAFPLAALIAIVNNIVEIFMDGFKLCNVYRRPQARPVKGIGVWQMAFEALSFLSVMTNCALICMSPNVRSHYPDLTLPEWILVGVLVEHVVIAIKFIIAYLISDVPKWVNIAIYKNQYEALQKVKQENREKAKKMKKLL